MLSPIVLTHLVKVSNFEKYNTFRKLTKQYTEAYKVKHLFYKTVKRQNRILYISIHEHKYV